MLSVAAAPLFILCLGPVRSDWCILQLYICLGWNHRKTSNLIFVGIQIQQWWLFFFFDGCHGYSVSCGGKLKKSDHKLRAQRSPDVSNNEGRIDAWLSESTFSKDNLPNYKILRWQKHFSFSFWFQHLLLGLLLRLRDPGALHLWQWNIYVELFQTLGFKDAVSRFF